MKKMFGALISSCIALVSLGCSENESENGLMLSTGSAKLLLRANAKQSQSLPLAHFDVDVALSPLFLQFWESGHWASVASSGSNAEFKAVIFDELGNYEGKFDLPLQVNLDESFSLNYIPPEEPMADYPGAPGISQNLLFRFEPKPNRRNIGLYQIRRLPPRDRRRASLFAYFGGRAGHESHSFR